MFRLPLLGLMFAAALGAQSPLVTTFANNAAGLPNGAAYYDLTVTASRIAITRMDMNLSGSGVVEIYTKAGSRTGSQLNPVPWTLRAVGVVSNAQAGVPTTVQLAPFELPQGAHGVAVRGIGMIQFDTIGNGSNQSYGNSHLQLQAGETSLALFTAPLFAARVPNVAIHYLVGDLVGIPGHNGNQSGHSSGFHFVAQNDFNIRQLALPSNAFQLGDTASYLVRINGAVAFRSIGNAGPVDVGRHVQQGDLVDVIANWTAPAGGQNSAHVSIASPQPFSTMINGVQHTLQRVGWSWNIGDPAWTPNGSTGFYLPPSTTSSFGRVLMTTEPGALTASNLKLGNGCVTTIGSCWELMPAPAFDMEFSAVTFTPQPGGGYVVTRSGSLLPVGATAAPVTLPLGDDTEVIVPFNAGSFPGWTGMTICSNGFVSKASGNGTDWSPSPVAMLDAPQTAFWSWHDYNPLLPGSGAIKMEQSVAVSVITWDGVWDWGASSPQGANTMQFQLYSNGTVTIAWGATSGAGNPHLVGYSPGGNSPDAPAIDLSALAASPLTLPGVERLPLVLIDQSRPVVGTAWNLLVDDIPATGTLGIDVLGLSDPGIDDLAFLGMPTCGLRASLDSMTAWLVSGSTHLRTLFVPNVVSLRGVTVFATTAVFTTPALNSFGAITSNGVRGIIGDL